MGPDVLDYLEYREFLRDWFIESKKRNRFTSYRYLARKTGLDAGWITRVLQKEGHLGEDSVPAFVTLCGFDERRSEYFRLLHRFCRTKSPEEQKDCYRRLMELKETEGRRLEAAELVYFSHWYIAALRALIGITQDTSDMESVYARLVPGISAEQGRMALDTLARLGMIAPDGNGGWNVTDQIVVSGGNLQSGAVRGFHHQMLQMATESLDRHAPEQRDISSVVLTIDEDDLDEVKERVSDFRRGLLQFARSSHQANRVYNLTVAFYPLSKRKES